MLRMGVLPGFLLISLVASVLGQCPPADDIRPCKCFESPHAVLECMGIHDNEVLVNVFKKSIGYKYNSVNIYFTTLQYLPHELFTHTKVTNLHLENSTLIALFDSPPDELKDLFKIHLENTKIYRLDNWNLFKPLTNLKIIEIYYNHLPKLDDSMDEFITTDLKQLSLYSTGTKKIQPGALTSFVNLEKLAIDACKLTDLSRDLFPRPFNVKHLYFNENNLQTIPDDLFVDMPQLQSLGLRSNFLTMLPESAFDGRSAQLGYLMLTDNPIICNCKLLWLIEAKPKVLTGECATPIRLHEKPLKDLTPNNFKC